MFSLFFGRLNFLTNYRKPEGPQKCGPFFFGHQNSVSYRRCPEVLNMSWYMGFLHSSNYRVRLSGEN